MSELQPETATPHTGPEGQATGMARMQALMARAPVAFGFVKGHGLLQTSEHFNQLFGLGEEPAAQPLSTRALFVSEAAHTGLNDRLHAALEAGYPLDEEVECVRTDGSRLWARLQITPVAWDAASPESLWIFEDVTAARQERLMPTWSARHDPVTELANRREFERRLSEHVGSRRHEPVSVLWIDLDRFGAVLKRSGHEVCNHFLKSLGQMLLTKVRASDPVARMEDDHFAVLLPDCDQQHAEIVAEKIRAAVFIYRMRWGQHRSRTMASIGVVQLHAGLETVESVLDAAQQACTQAKGAGGDSVRVFMPNPA
jgi:diguanylate cyclase (GGDEF)-like protein